MGITRKSVEGHRDNIYKKLETHSQLSLAMFAIQYGLVKQEILKKEGKMFFMK